MKEIRLLRANEIDLRIGQVIKDKQTNQEKGFTLLLYKDARCDMNILDETFGCLYWKREHSRDNANCTVSVWNDEIKEWVTKEDTGVESNTEAAKGLASDSFKRACVNFGIGRELYTAPFIYISLEVYKKNERFTVKEIGYNECREIDKLVIVDSKGKVAYELGKEVAREQAPKLSLSTFDWCKKLDIDLHSMATYLGKPYSELNDADCLPFIEKRKKARGIVEDESN